LKNLITIIILFFFSCNPGDTNKPIHNLSTKSPTEIVNERVTEYIRENANDPKSYEPITTYLKDSVTYMRRLNNKIDGAQASYDMEKSSLPNDRFTKMHKHELDSLLDVKDSLHKVKFQDFIQSYIFVHDCRIKNGFGGLVKTSFKIVTDNNLKIVSVTEDK
jgi:hypothetical protein